MFTMTATVFAGSTTNEKGTTTGTVPGGITISDPTIDPTMSDKVAQILGAIRWFGYAIALGMLLYIGIKYMMSAANEKADLKKGSINYVIGAVVVVAASTIFGAIQSWMDK
jgi:TRAP-type C4-dicarboxylate transport system permease small subunit